MADSDDEYDRKRRDKFRGERSTGSDSYRSERRDDRRTGISSVSGSGGRDDWSERNPFRGGGGAGRPRADFRDFNRPPRERYGSPVRDLPPAKRMRGDWGDDLRSAIPRYGGYDPYLMQAWNEHYAHSLHSAYAHAGGAGSVGHGAHPREPQASAADMQTQPPMMTLKQFLDTQDDGLSDAEVLRKYSEYKLEFKRQQLNEFFVSHKDEEWFKNKYHPLDSVKRKEEQQSFLQNRVNVFHELLQNGQIKAVSVDTAQTDPLLRLLDTVVIKLEGGTDDDLKILDEKPKDPPQFPERTFQRKNVEQDDDVIITAVGKKVIDKPVDDDKERKEREMDRKRERVQEEPRVISPQPMRRHLDSDDEENWDDDDDAPQLPMKINEPEADIKREIKERELDDDDQSKKAKSKKSLKRKRSDSNSSQSSSSSNSNSDSSSSSSSDEDDGGDADKQDKYNLEDLAAEKKIVEGVEAEKELEGKDELAEKAEETIEKANEEEDHAAKSPDSMRSEASEEEEVQATNEVEAEKVTDEGKNVALKAENGEDEDELMKTANVEAAEDNLSMHSTDAVANEGVAVKTEVDDQTTTTADVKTEALEEGETKNDADDEDAEAVGKKATEQEQPETIDLDKVKDGPQPRALHRTSSIFLRNLAPSITKEEIENICKAYEGYLRVAIADPLAERRWYRRGWVTFKRDVNIKEICWNLNNMRIKDCEMGAIVNRDLSRRVRPVNGMTAHKAIVRADIRLCAKIALNLDEKFKLWEAQAQSDAAAINGKENEANGAGGDGNDESNKPTNGVIVKSTNNASTSNYGFKSNNPVLQNITDFLIEEASAEEEELLGLSRDGKDSDGESIERDPQLIAVLDNLILYLRIVHSVDFYNHCEYPYEDEMPNRCGIIHARGPAPARITQNDIQDYIKNFETKMQPFLTKPSIIEDEELKNLGAKDTEAEVEKFIQANSQELAKDKWLCPLSGKKFKGPEFIRKHIFNKHAEKVEEVRKEVEYFNNYLRDPKRPQLPEHPGATKRTNSESSSGAATAGYRPPAYPPPYAPPYAAYAPPIMMPGRGRGGYGGGRRHGGGHFNEFRRLMHYRDLDAPQD